MLKTEALHVKAGPYSFKGVDLSVKEGECHVIVGPTGAGKTLLLESVVGFTRPLSGSIWLDGREITGVPVERRGIGYVPQDLAIFPHLNVEKNLEYGINCKKERRERLQAQLADLIEVVGIGRLLTRPVQNLSGGELQRVALVRALASGNRTILLDEPLSSLHESLKRELWFLLKELQQKFTLSILMVTHDLEEAYFLGDRLSILLPGRIEQTGRKGEIYYSPKTLEAARFVGIRNFFSASVTGIDSEKFIVFCKELNRSLVLKRSGREGETELSPGSTVTAAIRSEDVMFLREGYYRENQENLLTGRVVSLFEKGRSHTAIFHPEKPGGPIEIEVPDFAAKKIGLHKGKSTAVSLKSESLFLLTG